MKPNLIFVVIISAISLTACEKSLFNAGPSETQEFPITKNISLVIINKTFDITLIQDTLNKLLVTAGKNLLPDIRIYSQNDTLFLDDDIKYDWSRDYSKIKVEMHLTSLPRFDVMKPAHITTKDTFKSDHFQIVDWGKFSDVDVSIDVNSCDVVMSLDNFGKFVLRGKANYANLWGCGSVFIYADGLQVCNCDVYHRGIGDIYVNVSNILNVKLNSKGNVFYYGQPTESNIQAQTSTGRLIQFSP